MNKEWHDYIFSKCDSQQYSLEADDEKCTSLAELERAYRELYTEVYKENAHDISECAEKYKEEVEEFSRRATERVGWSAASWRDQHQQPPIALNRQWSPCPFTRMDENWGARHDPECHACGGSGRIGGPITCSNMQICHDEGFTRCHDCPVTR